MAKITHVATDKGIKKANNALKKIGSKTQLADESRTSRSTVNKFFNQQPIELDCFKKICNTLELEWEDIAELTVEELSEVNSEQKHFYAELENMLKSKNWEEADQVTSEIIWKLAGTSQERSFRAEVSRHFPCEVLRTIDALWTKYSDGRFGFSVQRSIWQSSDVNLDIDKFMSHVGWADWWQNEDGKRVFGFVGVKNFSDDALKRGQLPWLVTWEGSNGIRDRKAYLSRIVRCGI